MPELVGLATADKLAAALKDRVPAVRQAAAYALGTLSGRITEESVEALQAALNGPNPPAVRQEVAEALAKLGIAKSAQAAFARSAPERNFRRAMRKLTWQLRWQRWKAGMSTAAKFTWTLVILGTIGLVVVFLAWGRATWVQIVRS
jgi:HEAT repeats